MLTKKRSIQFLLQHNSIVEKDEENNGIVLIMVAVVEVKMVLVEVVVPSYGCVGGVVEEEEADVAQI